MEDSLGESVGRGGGKERIPRGEEDGCKLHVCI
jgi:hypothetical protein